MKSTEEYQWLFEIIDSAVEILKEEIVHTGYHPEARKVVGYLLGYHELIVRRHALSSVQESIGELKKMMDGRTDSEVVEWGNGMNELLQRQLESLKK